MLKKIKMYYIPILKKMFVYAPISIIITIIGQFFIAIVPAITTFLLAKLVEVVNKYIIGEIRTNAIFMWGGLLIGTYILKQIMELFLSITINAGVYEKCNSKLKIELTNKVSSLSLINFENSDILNMYYRAQDCVNREVPSNVFNSLIAALMSFISVISVMSVLMKYSVIFVPIAIISVLPFLVAKKIRGREFYSIKFNQTRDNRRLSYLWGLFSKKESVKEMRVMNFGEYIKKLWTTNRDKVNDEVWKYNLKEAKSLLFCDIIRVIGYVGSVIVGLFLLLYGVTAIGPFAASLSAFSNVQNTTRDFFVCISNLANNGDFLKDYIEFINFTDIYLEQPIQNANIIRQKSSGSDGIILEHVNFLYPNTDNFALKDINIEIKKGERIAIVGENGSGKTTLCKLILGVYMPIQGNLVSDFSINNLKVGLVAQNFIKYKLTLRECIAISNISQYNETDKIVKIIEKMGLEEIVNRGQGIDYQLGTEFGGKDFSGGQWQKIAIARAIFSIADLYVLDEPTSALDPLVELSIMNDFLKLAAQKTTLMVLHRMALCQSVDKIIVMKHGRILEYGTHEELMSYNGEYKKLYMEQSKWYQ